MKRKGRQGRPQKCQLCGVKDAEFAQSIGNRLAVYYCTGCTEAFKALLSESIDSAAKTVAAEWMQELQDKK